MSVSALELARCVIRFIIGFFFLFSLVFLAVYDTALHCIENHLSHDYVHYNRIE